jgi:hypothetical protein
MLVLSEIWDPDWVAEVDGKEVDILQVDFALRGIVVGPGEHEVVLRYPATLVRNTFALWLVPIFLVPLLLAGEYIWGRRQASTAASADPVAVPVAASAELPEWVDLPDLDDPFDDDAPSEPEREQETPPA